MYTRDELVSFLREQAAGTDDVVAAEKLTHCALALERSTDELRRYDAHRGWDDPSGRWGG